MKVILIYPHIKEMVDLYSGFSLFSDVMRRAFGWGRTNFVPPLSLLMLGAVTPPDIEVKIVDERIEAIDYDEPADLVGISVVTYSALRAYEISAEFHKRGVKVILGGVHPSAMPQEAVQHADSIVLGEGEGIWPEVLSDFQNGTLKPIYRGRAQMNLDTLPFPRRELIRHPEMYANTKVVFATRGCPNNCTFCTAGVGLIKKYRKRSVESVIQELEQIPGNFVEFVDDNMGSDPQYFKDLMRAMIPLRLRWSSAVCINALEDQEIVDLAVKSGCYSLGVGFESLSPKVLTSIRKDHTNHPERYAACIKRVQEAGMVAWGNFIVGFDDETKETFRELIDFIIETNLEITDLIILIPYPGSVLYKQYKREQRLLHENWNFYEGSDGICVYIPKQMTVEELMNGHLEVIEEIFTWKAIFWRMMRSKALLSFGILPALHLNIQSHKRIAQQKIQAQKYKDYLRSLNLQSLTTKYQIFD
jgi:radical SAM superfamily enzyme YgiQ (UPF0313 family)